MAAQDEREPGGVVMDMSSVVGRPMVQDIPEQDESLPQTNPKLEMGAVAAAVDFATPPILRQIPPPVPSKNAHHNGGSRQLSPLEVKLIMERITQMSKKMDANMQAFRSDMRALRGETRQMGQCLQADNMATPCATSSELKGSTPAGEDRVSRETCWARRVEVTETVTRTLKGEETTCTRHQRQGRL